MGRKRQYPGLWNRGGTWWIEKTIRVADKASELRESTGQTCFEVAVQVYLKRVREEAERLLFGARPAYTVGQAAAEFLARLKRKLAEKYHGSEFAETRIRKRL